MIPDIYKLHPKLARSEQDAEELRAKVHDEEHKFRALEDRLRNGPSAEDRKESRARILAGQEIPDIEAEHRRQRERVLAMRDAADEAKKVAISERRIAAKTLTD